MIRIKLLLFTCALALLVTACGQRGPLYLPDPEAKPEITEEQMDNDEENSGT